MAFRKNVGGRDRTARAVAAAALVVAAAATFLAGRRQVAVLAAIGGAGLLFNVATRFCAVNALLGVDTCSRE